MTKTCKFRPTPAEVIEAANIEMEIAASKQHTTFEQISQEERNAALQETAELREKLRATLHAKEIKPESADEELLNPREIFTPEQWEATEKAYKEYLTKEFYKDEYNRAHGISPIPRSREEHLAIYYNLPMHERQRVKKFVRPN